MVIRAVTLTVHQTVNEPSWERPLTIFVNDQRPLVFPLTDNPVPNRFRANPLTGSTGTDLSLLGTSNGNTQGVR